jgi:succinate-acetate transporter protein
MEVKICDDREKWDGGTLNLAYLDLKTKNIHILSPQLMFNEVLEHEMIHYKQKQKWTQWIAALANFKSFFLLFIIFIISAIIDFKPLFNISGAILILIGFCYMYVEYIVIRREKNGKIKLKKTQNSLFGN